MTFDQSVKITFYFLDCQLDSLAYDQMGPAHEIIRSKDGQKLYLVISYRRGRQIHRLKVPLHYSGYYSRSPMFFKHPYGKLLNSRARTFVQFKI